MTTLHDRLASLAGDVTLTPTPPDLWEQGRRLHRRRRRGTAVIAAACCLLFLVLGVIDWQQSRVSVQPASGDAEFGLPDHIHTPSRWLRGTGGEPFDPLIATLYAERSGWFGSEREVVGISALTGEYRFLDLPDDVYNVRLSPDGRRVAYWFTGPAPEYVDHWDSGDPIIGYAVYDVTTATIERTVIESDEGLMEHFLGWADNEHLVLSYSFQEWQDERTGWLGRNGESNVLDLVTGSVTPLPRRHDLRDGGSGWIISWGTPSQARSVDDPDRVIRLRGSSGVPPVPSPSGTRFAGLLEVETAEGTVRSTPNPIGIATAGASPQARFHQTPSDTPYYRLLGWRDDDTVLAWRWTEDQEFGHLGEVAMYAVDIHTGEEEFLSILDQEVRFAQGLLDAPVVSRPAPPQPFNPWLKVTTASLILLAAGFALIVWRRNVRP